MEMKLSSFSKEMSSNNKCQDKTTSNATESSITNLSVVNSEKQLFKRRQLHLFFIN